MTVPVDAFDPPPGASVALESYALAATGDFDGDGRADLAFGTPSEFWFALGPDLALRPLAARPMFAADVNGDGYDDLVVTDATGASVIDGAADGPTGPIHPLGAAWTGAPLGDLDGDGFDDVALGDAVWFGAPTGLEQGSPICPDAPVFGDAALDAGEVDGDGRPDILASCRGALVLVAVDGRALGPPRELPLAAWPVALADADADGVDELFYVDSGEHAYADQALIGVVELTDPLTYTDSVFVEGYRGEGFGTARDAATGRQDFLFAVDADLARYALVDGVLEPTSVTRGADPRYAPWFAAGADFDGNGVDELATSWISNDYARPWGLVAVWGYDHGFGAAPTPPHSGDTGAVDTSADTGAGAPPKAGASEGCGCDGRGAGAAGWLVAFLAAIGGRRR